MRFNRLENFWNGWIIGNFDPSILKTDQFEVAVLHHRAGLHIPVHYQITATEYNIMISGKMIVNDVEVTSGDVFVYEPKEITRVVVLEDTVVVCIKTPSIPGDKVLV
jgi:quercetin dioxygenase-like cupin family protein